jgi:spore germination protein GerM
MSIELLQDEFLDHLGFSMVSHVCDDLIIFTITKFNQKHNVLVTVSIMILNLMNHLGEIVLTIVQASDKDLSNEFIWRETGQF